MRAFMAVFVVALFTGCSSKPRPVDPHASPWSTVRIGSVFESETVTRLEKPFARETRTTTKQTLLGKSAAEATVRLELTEGSKTSAQDLQIPLRQDKAAPHDGSTVTTVDEKTTVPAGTFDCTKTTVEVRQGDVTRSNVTWTAKGIPVPVQSIVTNENMTATTQLTRLTVAR